MGSIILNLFKIIILLMFYSPFFAAIWMVFDVTRVVLQGEPVQASISHCEKRAKSSGNRIVGGWVPIAVTQDGTVVEGNFAVKSEAWCLWQVSENVTVYRVDQQTTPYRIVNFWQFLFLPLVISLIGGLVAFLGIRQWLAKSARREGSR